MSRLLPHIAASDNSNSIKHQRKFASTREPKLDQQWYRSKHCVQNVSFKSLRGLRQRKQKCKDNKPIDNSIDFIIILSLLFLLLLLLLLLLTFIRFHL